MRRALFIGLLLLLASCAKKAPGESSLAPVPAAVTNDSVVAADPTALLSELTQAVRRYAAEQQKVPASLDELVAKQYLPAVPAPPPGKKFAIDKMLRVYLADR